MTCYKPGRSKTWFFGLNPKGAKFDFTCMNLCMHTGSGLGLKAATLVCEFEKLAFVYFALVSLTSVHKIQKMVPKMAPGISGSP